MLYISARSASIRSASHAMSSCQVGNQKQAKVENKVPSKGGVERKEEENRKRPEYRAQGTVPDGGPWLGCW